MIIFPIIRAVRDIRGLKFAQKSILLTLALHCTAKDGRNIYIAQADLAAEAGGNVKSCYTALKKLEEGEWIFREEKRGHMHGYGLNLEKLGLAPGTIALEELEELPDLPEDALSEDAEHILQELRQLGEEDLTDEEVQARRALAIKMLLSP